MAHQAGAYPGFCSMKRLGVFLLPLDGMLVHRRVTPSIKVAGTHLYTWVERGTVRVKCLAQEHNAMSSARARTRAARPGDGDERTNHEATAAPTEGHNNGHGKKQDTLFKIILPFSKSKVAFSKEQNKH